MLIRTKKNDLVWSYLGYFLSIANGLIVLPFIIKFLNPNELGLWYIFLSIGALVNLLDFGFSPTIARNVSYAWCGASELKKTGVSKTSNSKGPNYLLLKNIFSVTRKIYWIISAIAFCFLISIGTIYILSISSTMTGLNHIISWGIYCLGIFFNIYYNYWSPLLNGIGAIKEGQIASIASRIIQIVLTIVGLFLSIKLIAVSLAFLISGFVLRFLSKHYFYRNINIESFDLNFDYNKYELRQLLKTIWHNAWRLGLVSMGAFLIAQSNTLLCSSYFGLAITAQYGLTLQLLTILGALSGTLYRVYLPELTQAFLFNDKIRIKQIISISSFIHWLIFISGVLFIVFFGGNYLIVNKSTVTLLPQAMIIFISIYIFLESNHTMFATFISCGNKIPFMYPALFSGLMILSSSILLMTFTSIGFWGLLISQAIVQVFYNNWKWPYVIFREFNLNPLGIIKTGVKWFLAQTKIVFD